MAYFVNLEDSSVLSLELNDEFVRRIKNKDPSFNCSWTLEEGDGVLLFISSNKEYTFEIKVEGIVIFEYTIISPVSVKGRFFTISVDFSRQPEHHVQWTLTNQME